MGKEAQEHPAPAHTDPEITEPNTPIVRKDSGGTNGNSNTGIKNNEPTDNSPHGIGTEEPGKETRAINPICPQRKIMTTHPRRGQNRPGNLDVQAGRGIGRHAARFSALQPVDFLAVFHGRP